MNSIIQVVGLSIKLRNIGQSNMSLFQYFFKTKVILNVFKIKPRFYQLFKLFLASQVN
jgi:hypothetical protein